MQLLVVTTEIFGLSIKTKIGGAWAISNPLVKVGGSWVPVNTMSIKVGGSWQEVLPSVYTFPTGEHNDIDLDSLSLDRTGDVRIIIPAGAVIVASTTLAFAMKTGTGYGGTLTIQNAGLILGRGGKGGGGGGNSNGLSGHYGGRCILVESNVIIQNTGTISGGGGGGGGGAGALMSGNPSAGVWRKAGSGGGGGAPYGLGGEAENNELPSGSNTFSFAGNAATLTSAGAGGANNAGSFGVGGSNAGGAGGAYLQVGSDGDDFTQSNYDNKDGGSGGYASPSNHLLQGPSTNPNGNYTSYMGKTYEIVNNAFTVTQI